MRRPCVQEGVRALFHGTVARAANMGISTGIMLGCYSVFRSHVGLRLGLIDPPPPPPHEEAYRPRKQRLQPWHTEAIHAKVMAN